MTPAIRHAHRPLALAIVFALQAAGAEAATVTVEVGYDSASKTNCPLRAAISAINVGTVANSGCSATGDPFGTNDAIAFAPSVAGATISLSKDLGPLNIAKSVTIAGSGQTIDAGGYIRALYINAVTLDASSLTITGGAASRGAGVYARFADVTLTDTTITGNTAQTVGGGIYVYGGTLALTDSVVSSNSSNGVSSRYATLTLNHTTVSDNAGGGLFVAGSTTTLSNGCVVSNNTANKGGGLSFDGGRLTLTDAFLTGNTATVYNGGGLATGDGGTVTLVNTAVVGNSAAGRGGGLYLYDGRAIMSGGYVYGNVAEKGAGIEADLESFDLNLGSIEGNTATISGGGLTCGDLTHLTLTDTLVSENVAEIGGGIYAKNCTSATIHTSFIVANLAAYGGGIAERAGSTLTLTDTGLFFNTAALGGGLDIGSDTAYLANTTISGNTTVTGALGGGGIYSKQGTLTAANVTIAGNASNEYGGGALLVGATVAFLNSILAGNSAPIGGADLSQYFGAMVSADYCVLGNALQVTFQGNGNLFADDPKLDDPAYNGGLFPTLALLDGSPALDAADPALAIEPSSGDPLNYDQRGRGFPRMLSGKVDIGAFQHQGGRIFADGLEPEP